MKWALNQWYSDFYDLLGAANVGSGEEDDTESKNEVWRQLWWFCVIVSPAVVVHPLGKWMSSVWRYSWRVSLIRCYLAHWNTSCSVCEGASQRIHEDTLKFEQGVYYCFATALDSLFTLIVFVPVLWNVGEQARWSWWDWPGWLFTIAMATSISGLFVSGCVGWELVTLEVQNQRVEAKLRTRLVLLETAPSMIVEHEENSDSRGRPSFKRPTLYATGFPPQNPTSKGPFTTTHMTSTAKTRSATELPEDTSQCASPRVKQSELAPKDGHAQKDTPAKAFVAVLDELWLNYKSLYRQFAKFDLWIASFDQIMIVLPYFLVAPLLFVSPSRRITLGVLVRTTNAFDKVFNALAVLTNNWAQVNEWRSCLYRLREFEHEIYSKRPYDHTLLLSGSAGTSDPVFDEYIPDTIHENRTEDGEKAKEIPLATITLSTEMD